MVAEDPRIELAGALPREELSSRYEQADVVISPALWDCWPHAVLEAFDHGRPVLATPLGGHQGMVEPGRSGWLTADPGPEAIATAIEAVIADGPAGRRLERAGFTVCVLDDMSDEEAIEAVAAHLDAVKADVVHNHMYRAEVIGTQAAWRLASLGKRRPYVVGTVHSSRVRSAEDRALISSLTPSIDHLIAVSRAIVRKLEDEDRTAAPISLIYNGVDLTRYAEPDVCGTLHEEFPIPVGAPIVGVVARLEPEKGHPTLLEAWPAVVAAVPEAHLLIVGEGSQRETLEAQAAALAIEASVTFTGRRDDVPAVTAALDVAVLPSYREAQGLSILEAMALSRPVVASAVGGIPEMIEDGRTGILVPPHDAAALSAAIIRQLRDHPYADTIARAGRDLVHDRFCVELMVRAIETIYDESVADERRLAAV
jgi:glycosyltransferase involved in cell wall biosynthesis